MLRLFHRLRPPKPTPRLDPKLADELIDAMSVFYGIEADFRKAQRHLENVINRLDR